MVLWSLFSKHQKVNTVHSNIKAPTNIIDFQKEGVLLSKKIKYIIVDLLVLKTNLLHFPFYYF